MKAFPARLGVVLFNLGGPDTLDDVEPFLANLFADPEILPIPLRGKARLWLAKKIAAFRGAKARRHYAAIGGGSPLRARTQQQAEALERLLRAETGAEVFVRMGMRYWHPFTSETIAELRSRSIEDVFLLPLYPHFSVTSSGSSFKDWKHAHNAASCASAAHAANGMVFRVQSIKDFHLHSQYISALSATLDEGLRRFTAEERRSLQLLFSAHGTPASVAEHGDPYRAQIIASVDAVMRLRQNDLPHVLSFQSRVGPAKWLKPYTVDVLRDLGAKGTSNVLVVPLSFVSDHVETLYELNIEVREIAERAGITHYEVAPALNGSPAFIAALASIVRSRYLRYK